MNDDSQEQIEQHLARLHRSPPPIALRARTLKLVHRQLAGQLRERQLGRITIVILVLGIGLNWSVGWRDRDWSTGRREIASRPNSDAIVQVAVAIGQATDAETGSRLAQHLAALSGVALSPQQTATIDQGIQRRVKPADTGRKDGSS
jgi:hypothetical protein